MIKEKLSKFNEIMEPYPSVTFKVHIILCTAYKMDEDGNVWIDDTYINRFHWECNMECEYEVVN